MSASTALKLTATLNLLLSKSTASEIGIEFDEIAEQLRHHRIKIHIAEKYCRQFDLELYFALERKNKASFIGNFVEANRLRQRIKDLLQQKSFHTLESSRIHPGHFKYVSKEVIMGILGRAKKNERILLRFLQGYDLVI